VVEPTGGIEDAIHAGGDDVHHVVIEVTVHAPAGDPLCGLGCFWTAISTTSLPMSHEPLVTEEMIARQPPETQAIIRILLAKIEQLEA